MQLKQKYTINNVTYENEMFISEKDNVNIIGAIEYFFNIPNACKKLEVISISEKDEQPTKQVVNNTVFTVPVEHEEKETPVPVIEEEDKSGYYIKYKVRDVEYERWSNAKNENNAKAIVYSTAKKESWMAGYKVNYEILEIKPMTEQEFNNRHNK